MRGPRVPGWVWVGIVLLHAAGFAWALHSGHWNFPDSARYRQAGRNLVQHGQLYARPWPGSPPHGPAVQEFTIRPIGYPAVLAAVGSERGNPVAVLLLQNALSLLVMGAVLHGWARVARPQGQHWLGAMGMVVAFPAQIIYANAVMSELLLQACLAAAVGAGLLFVRTGRLRYAWGAAVALALALLLKPICYPLAGIVAVGAVGLAWRQRRGMLLVAGLLPLLVTGSYMSWNQQRTGYFHFSSIAEINLLHYNAAGVVRQLNGPVAEQQWVAGVLREANAQPDFGARQQLIRARAEAVLWAHPLVYARQHALGMAALLVDPGRFDISEFLGLEPLPGGGLLAQLRANGLRLTLARLPLKLLLALAGLLLANALRLLLAARGFRALGRGPAQWRVGRWVAVSVLAYLALLTGPLGAARFLVPGWPLLLALALLGVRGPAALAPKQPAAGNA